MEYAERKERYIRKTARYNGKKYEAYGATELEAMTKLAEKLAAAKRGEEAINSGMTVSAWYKEWKATYKDPKGLTPKSLGMYDEKFNKYIKPAIGHLKLQDVRDIHLQKILNNEAGRSVSHLKKLRMVMQEMFRRARQSRLIIYDPAELLELPQATQGFRRSITEEERKAILEVCKTHRSGLWIQTLLYTGMRPGETAALTWADVDFDKNEIHVRTARESGSQKIKAPKTPAGIRNIPIHTKLRPLLLEAQGNPKAPVFPTGHGNFQNENSLRRMWTGFRRDLDIYMGAELKRNKIVKSVIAEDLVPYCLRHTFATDAQKNGVSLNAVKELMGHSDITVTANTYTHSDDSFLHECMSRIDGTYAVGKQAGSDQTGDAGGNTGGTSENKIRETAEI